MSPTGIQEPALDDWGNLIKTFQKMPHVVAVAPVLYDQVFLTGPHGAKLVTLKGIDTRAELAASDGRSVT